ncbi:hypothetical protein [Marinoscillum furvescens]|uniref:Uncharacterized protein n=1 Tax=Marinoscillum furvescens DSM 4134 TaxID=1122208 RepID=A0A3D9L003_MARFU|nr:hypothetical protein [Marinoscillum furvescens]RED92981.1 hypothetical protein C7460_1275 [Marinoscillum furvescens DSM 4134]
MGIFNFSRKRKDKEVRLAAELEKITLFSHQAIQLAASEIETTDSFLPFGGILTSSNNFELVVYHDPNKTTIDHREHATTIQNIIQKKYAEPKNILFLMAWDGTAHLPDGDADCINVKVDNKLLDIHKIFTYIYEKIDGKVVLLNKDKPIVKDL